MKPVEITLVRPAVVVLASVWGAALGGCAFLVPNKPPPAAARARQAPPPPPPYVAPNLKHTRAELEEQVATETTGYEKKGESPGKLDPFCTTPSGGFRRKPTFRMTDWVTHARSVIRSPFHSRGDDRVRSGDSFSIRMRPAISFRRMKKPSLFCPKPLPFTRPNGKPGGHKKKCRT